MPADCLNRRGPTGGMLKDFAISIIQTLRQQGFQAYLAGGCVRDLLLKREPADYDVATSATPAQVMEIFPETYAVGAQFGVVLVPFPEDHRVPDGKVFNSAETAPRGSAIEVATFRSDLGYSDGRHPDEVRFSQDPQRGCRAPRLHHQRNDARSGQRTKCSTLWADVKTSKRASSAPSATRSGALPKTSCACCARCALRRALSMRSKPKRWRRFKRLAHGNSGGLARAGSR